MSAGRAGALGVAAAALAYVVFSAGTRPPPPPEGTIDTIPLPSCTKDVRLSGRVFHVDPVRGSIAGDGSAARPWRDLRSLVSGGLIGEYRRRLWRADRYAASVTGRAPVTRLAERRGAVVRSGDTLLLADGDYGLVDLSGLANAGFVTIAAAPSANVRLSGLNLSGASHFVLRGLRIVGDAPASQAGFLATTYAPGPHRADNIVLDNVEIGWTTRLAEADPADFSARAPSGLQFGGDCLTLTNSHLHDLESGLNIYRARKVLVAGNAVTGVSVDGIQFSGRDLTIRDNAIFGQRPVPGRLHPDCMQGQLPERQSSGPVMIERNLCLRAPIREPSQQRTDRFGWQGIVIFDGRWRDVTIRCNIVLPANQHGIALYGATNSLIEHNTVFGNAGGRPSWIAVLPAKDGRPSAGVRIRENRASAYLNAVIGAPLPPDAMLDALKVKRGDRALVTTLMQPLDGVVLERNTWAPPQRVPGPLTRDPRFIWEPAGSLPEANSVAEALRQYPLPPACTEPEGAVSLPPAALRVP